MTSQNAVPPDGGWGWMVVAGAALQWFFYGGLIRSFSLIHEQMRIRYDASASAVAAVFSFHVASALITSPLSAALSTRVTARQGALIGTTLMFTGVLSTAFAPSITVIYFTYGIMAGTGLGLIGTMKLITTSRWFRKKLGRAISLSVTADGLGAMALSPLLDFMFGYYGYTGTMMFISALTLHGLVLAMVLIPPPCPGRQNSKLEVEVQHVTEQNSPACNKDQDDGKETPQSLRSRIHSSVGGDDENKEWVVSLADNLRRSSTSRSNCSINRSTKKISTEDNVTEHLVLCEFITAKHSASSSDDIEKDKKFEATQNATKDFVDLKNDCSAVKNGHHQLTEKGESGPLNLQSGGSQSEAEQVSYPSSSCCDGSLSKFYSYLDIRLLCRSSFLTFALLMTSTTLCNSMSNTHMVGMALDRSVTSHQVAILLAIVGGLTVLTKVFSGFLFDLRCFKAIRIPVFAILSLISGLILICIPLTSGAAMFYFMWLLNAVFISVINTQESVILNDLVPRQHFASAIGLSRFFRGLGVIIGPTVGGLLKDKTGDYTSTFYFGGSIFFLSSIIFELNLLRRHIGLCKKTINT